MHKVLDHQEALGRIRRVCYCKSTKRKSCDIACRLPLDCKSQTQNLSNVRVRARLIEKHSLVELCARLPEIQTFKLAIDDVALDQVFNLSPELVRKPHTDVVVVDDQLLGTILQKRLKDRVYRPKINGVIGKQTV